MSILLVIKYIFTIAKRVGLASYPRLSRYSHVVEVQSWRTTPAQKWFAKISVFTIHGYELKSHWLMKSVRIHHCVLEPWESLLTLKTKGDFLSQEVSRPVGFIIFISVTQNSGYYYYIIYIHFKVFPPVLSKLSCHTRKLCKIIFEKWSKKLPTRSDSKLTTFTAFKFSLPP